MLKLRHFQSRQNKYSGAWLSSTTTATSSYLSNAEFKASLCRLNTVKHDDILTFNPQRAGDDPQLYLCSCEGGLPKPLSYGYHFVGCRVDGNAIILHDTVAHAVAWLFRSTLGTSVCLEPLRLFEEVSPDDKRRPDISLRNPHGGGRRRCDRRRWLR